MLHMPTPMLFMPNSAALPGQAQWSGNTDLFFTVPADVYFVSAAVVGPGAPVHNRSWGGNERMSGGGGGLAWTNAAPVTPGQQIRIQINDSIAVVTGIVSAVGGSGETGGYGSVSAGTGAAYSGGNGQIVLRLYEPEYPQSWYPGGSAAGYAASGSSRGPGQGIGIKGPFDSPIFGCGGGSSVNGFGEETVGLPQPGAARIFWSGDRSYPDPAGDL